MRPGVSKAMNKQSHLPIEEILFFLLFFPLLLLFYCYQYQLCCSLHELLHAFSVCLVCDWDKYWERRPEMRKVSQKWCLIIPPFLPYYMNVKTEMPRFDIVWVFLYIHVKKPQTNNKPKQQNTFPWTSSKQEEQVSWLIPFRTKMDYWSSRDSNGMTQNLLNKQLPAMNLCRVRRDQWGLGTPNPSRRRVILQGGTRRAFGKRDIVGWATGVEEVENIMQIAGILSHPKATELRKLKFPELSEGQSIKTSWAVGGRIERERGEKSAERT